MTGVIGRDRATFIPIMKRVRSDSSCCSIAICNVPCSLAGNMRRIDYMALRNEVLGLHLERNTLSADFAHMTSLRKAFNPKDSAAVAQWRSIAQTILDYETFFSQDKARTQRLEAEWWSPTSAEAPSVLVRSIYDAWRKIHEERKTAFQRRLDTARERLNARSAHWTSNVPGFHSHLRGNSDPECECFLCIDEFYVPPYKGDAEYCYFCLAAIDPPSTTAITSRAAQIRALACDACYDRAQRDGVCAFCYGHVSESGTTNTPCAGRRDLRLSPVRPFAASPISSSDCDVFR